MIDGKVVWNYSQGYGHKCYGGAISERASKQILYEAIENLMTKIRLNYPDLSDRQVVAMTSLAYNTPITNPVFSDKFKKAIESEERKVIEENWRHWRLAGTIYEDGLLKRRNEELEMFYN